MQIGPMKFCYNIGFTLPKHKDLDPSLDLLDGS